MKMVLKWVFLRLFLTNKKLKHKLVYTTVVFSSRSSCNVIEYTALEKMANISGIFDKTEVREQLSNI